LSEVEATSEQGDLGDALGEALNEEEIEQKEI